MKTKVLFTDEIRIKSIEEKTEKNKKKVQQVVDVFLSLNLVDAISDELVKHILQNPENTVKSIYMQRLPEVDKQTGLKNNKEKMISQMELPDLSELKESVEVVKNAGIEFNFYDIKNNKVVINEKEVNRSLDVYRKYANNEKEAELFDKLEHLKDVLNELNENTGFLKASNQSGLNYNLKNLFRYRIGRLEIKQDGFFNIVRKFANN